MTEITQGWSRDVERVTQSLLGILQAQAAMGEVYLYPQEVRKTLRMVGVPLDEALPEMPEYTFAFEQEDEDYDPSEVGLNDGPEEDPDA